MISVQLADGTELEFPEGTADAVIDKAVKSHLQPAKSEPGFLEQAGRFVQRATPAGLLASLVTPEGRKDAANAVAGGVRGAGSIGATALAPVDVARDALAGKGLSLESNRQRRADMDATLADMGADTNSLAYQAGKLGMEVAGSSGAGGLVAKGASKVPGISPALIEAVRTGGMSAQGGGALTRAAGGAISGGATAGIVNPEDTAAGAVIGGVAPSVVQGVGKVGEKIGAAYQNRLADQLRKYEASAPLRQTISESLDAGYTIPPSSVDPSLKNRLLESISGKQATQQLVSTKNTDVTDRLVRKGLGMQENAPLNQSALENIRKQAGGAYKQVADLSPEAAADLEALKVARNEAQGWFKAYNRSARPDDLAKAKEARALAEKLEQALEGYAEQAGKSELIPALRDARQQIAKTYTVGRALNDASGTVDARVLGRLYEKGTPLTGELEQVGKFGSAFPTAAKTPQQIGSPDVHNLKSMASLLMGGGGIAATGPVGITAAAVPYIAPPMARAALLSKGAQRSLVQQAPKGAKAAQLASALRDPEFQQVVLRSAPVLGTQP